MVRVFIWFMFLYGSCFYMVHVFIWFGFYMVQVFIWFVFLYGSCFYMVRVFIWFVFLYGLCFSKRSPFNKLKYFNRSAFQPVQCWHRRFTVYAIQVRGTFEPLIIFVSI